MAHATLLIGTEHHNHVAWLWDVWMQDGPPVCFLEGFPGTGKTTIARVLLERAASAKVPAVMIAVPETDGDPTDDMLLNLATELNSAGNSDLARAIENNRSLLDVLSNVVEQPVLIVIDEFQHTMRDGRAMTTGAFAKVLSKLAERRRLKGRILLLTNRLVERARWSDPYVIQTLNGMSPDDGVTLLEHFARESGRLDEIDPTRRHDVVKWLGGNPRALRLLVTSLAYESLDDLIEIQPELWEMRDRGVSPELVEELERQLLEKTFSQLSDDYLRRLHRLCVHRKPFKLKGQAMERFFDNDKALLSRFRREMVDRFLLEQHNSWYSLHPIVREIGLQKLATDPADFQKAHSLAAEHYMRHFEAKQIVGWGELGGHFVEARYHLVKAGRPDDLKDIAAAFQSYIFDTLRGVPPIPRNPEELDERIAVLSALLQNPGPKRLEYHLARLFQARNQRNDLRRALEHANRAKSDTQSEPWLLRSELLVQMARPEEALAVLKQGIERIPPDKSLVALYHRYGELLVQAGWTDEAIAALKQGIDRIPPDKSLVTLYISYGELLVQMGRTDEGVTVLKQGIERIPPDKSLVALYHRYGELLVQMGRTDEALGVLKQGIERIPTDKNLADLFTSCARLLAQMGQYNEALAVLKQGIERIPPDKSLVALYHHYGELLTQMGRTDEALAVLKQGIDRIPPDKGIVSLYTSYGELLAQMGRTDEAIVVLKRGIDRIPPDQGTSSFYQTCIRVFLLTNQVNKAIEISLEGIRKIPMQSGGFACVDALLLLYTARQDKDSLAQLMRTNNTIPANRHALAQVLLYQLEERWADAAACAEKMRTSEGQFQYANPVLASVEAFAWLCAGQPERALAAISSNLKAGPYQNRWLCAFIHLRLGNREQAKEALLAYDPQTAALHVISETVLLALWEQPATSVDQYDLAYYFPILPPTLTGLPHTVTRIAYHPAVLPEDVKNGHAPSHDRVQQQAGNGKEAAPAGSTRRDGHAVPADQPFSTAQPLRVFLCHVAADLSAVRDLYHRLQADGVVPWFDEEDLLPGQNWREEIRRVVKTSDIVLVCLSRSSVNQAGHVQKEIKLALDTADEQSDGTIFVIPVRLEECDLPERLHDLRPVDLFAERGYERLMRALQHRADQLGRVLMKFDDQKR